MFISLEIRGKLSLAWFLSMNALELVSHKHEHSSQSSISLKFCVSANAISFRRVLFSKIGLNFFNDYSSSMYRELMEVSLSVPRADDRC